MYNRQVEVGWLGYTHLVGLEVLSLCLSIYNVLHPLPCGMIGDLVTLISRSVALAFTRASAARYRTYLQHTRREGGFHP